MSRKQLLDEALSKVGSKVLSEEVRNQLTEAYESALKEEIESMNESFEKSIQQISEDFVVSREAEFDKAVEAKASEISKAFATELNEKASIEVKEKFKEMEESLDAFTTHIAEKWVNENQVALEESAKIAKADAIIAQFEKLGNAFGVSIKNLDESEDGFDIQESYQEALQEIKQLKESIAKERKAHLVYEACEGLTIKQADRLVRLSESLDFDESKEDDFKSELEASKALLTGEENVVESKEDSSSGTYIPSWKRK